MKKQQVIAVVIVLLLVGYSIFHTIRFYSWLLEKQADFGYTIVSPLQVIQDSLKSLKDLLLLVLSGIFLLSSDMALKDKAYRYIRFIFVISFFIYLPVTFVNVFSVLQNDQAPGIDYWTLTSLLIGAQTAAVILLLKNKPVKQIQRINLEEYELVAYTTGLHRFVHYLLDILFLLPVTFVWGLILEYSFRRSIGIGALQIIFPLLYLLYCFLSEAIFKQTFGKMITNSCVVSNGTPMSSGRVFVRTLCRLIPFDGLSFLFRGNWHDKASATSVVYVDTWQKILEESTS